MPERTWDDIVSGTPTPSYEANVTRTLYQENTILRSAIEEAITDIESGDVWSVLVVLRDALGTCDKLP